MPQIFRVDAFQTASFLINRMPTPLLKNKSPFEVIFENVLDYCFLKVSGCLCWPSIGPYNRHKINFYSVPCVFLGYIPSHKGYICRALNTNLVYISRKHVFDEVNFPYSKLLSTLIDTLFASCYYWPSQDTKILPHPCSCRLRLSPCIDVQPRHQLSR
jgi:hypothetical protein